MRSSTPRISSLLGGGGVDGAIHRAAGPGLLAVCRLLGGCEVGDAKVTTAFGLPARWIIHTVGPVWHGGTHGEAELLASCYRRALEEADGLNAETVAFPSIATGVYSYPIEAACEVALAAVTGASTNVSTVRFVVFDEENERCVPRTSCPSDRQVSTPNFKSGSAAL